jgi:serine/threonine protein kinase
MGLTLNENGLIIGVDVAKKVEERKAGVTSYRMHVVNKMSGEGDFQKLNRILLEANDSPLRVNDDYFLENGMTIIGCGHFGRVFEYIGSDGYAYAVKVARYDSQSYLEHDGQILHKLQGIDGYPKLFYYIEGKADYLRKSWGKPEYGKEEFNIMVSRRVNGFSIRNAIDIAYCRKDFFKKASLDILTQMEDTIKKTYDLGYYPDDTHSDNVMIDMDNGNAVIVDVGYFKKLNSDFSLEESYITSRLKYSNIHILCKMANEKDVKFNRLEVYK